MLQSHILTTITVDGGDWTLRLGFVHDSKKSRRKVLEVRQLSRLIAEKNFRNFGLEIFENFTDGKFPDISELTTLTVTFICMSNQYVASRIRIQNPCRIPSRIQIIVHGEALKAYKTQSVHE
jgi:hypothetical protein